MREHCKRCRRPVRVCYCGELKPVDTRTRVVLLQHPRERRVAIGTARIAHLGLANSELHVGVTFEDDRRIQELAARTDGSVGILYPTEDAVPASSLRGKLETLIVVDGTWSLAKKLLRVNPLLEKLPRIKLTPTKPGNYRIRKEPAEHCLATVEAVAQVLAELEGDTQKFDGLIAAFDRMVDQQIACEETHDGPSRYKIHKPVRHGPWVPPELRHDWDQVVLAYAEANAPAFKAETRFTPELIHLVAERLATGERFEAVVAPRHPLSPGIPGHIGLTPEQILVGEPAALVAERFRAFVGGGVLATWGHFTQQLLEAEQAAPGRRLDVRLAAARRLKRNPGGPDTTAELLGVAPGAPMGTGRAGKRLALIRAAVEGLRAPALQLRVA